MAFSLLKIKARVAELAHLRYSAVRPLGPILAHPIENFDEMRPNWCYAKVNVGANATLFTN